MHYEWVCASPLKGSAAGNRPCRHSDSQCRGAGARTGHRCQRPGGQDEEAPECQGSGGSLTLGKVAEPSPLIASWGGRPSWDSLVTAHRDPISDSTPAYAPTPIGPPLGGLAPFLKVLSQASLALNGKPEAGLMT